MGQKVRAVLRPIISILFAFCIVAVIILMLGKSPLAVFGTMFEGAFGSKNAVAETLLKASTLVMVGLSYAFASKCGLVNIGIEGQLYMGALGSTLVGVYVSLPAFLHLPLCFLAGFVFGGVWGGIVAWLKNSFGANEIITTVMMNYVARYLIGYMVTGPLKEPGGMNPQTAPIADTAKIPILVAGTRLNWGFVFALVMLAAYFIYWRYTTAGYEMTIAGHNNNVAAYAGMNVKRVVLSSMLVAGGLGGLAGSLEILGIQYRLKEGFSAGYGFDGIAVALLGNNTAPGILFSSILFGGLRTGGNRVQMTEGIPAAVTSIIQGLVILFVLIDFLRTPTKKPKARKAGAMKEG